MQRYLRGRVKELSDPRVNERTVEAFSEALPLALALINARLALRAAERDDDSVMSFHQKMLSEFTSEAIAIWALKRAVKPLMDELQMLSETARQSDESHDPLQKAQRVLEQVMHPVRILNKLLPNDLDVQVLRDKVAMAVRQLVLAATKPDDLSRVSEIVKLLKAAANIAGTSQAKKSLRDEASKLEILSQLSPILNELTALLKTALLKEAASKAQGYKAMDDAEWLLNKAEPLLRQLDIVPIEDDELKQLRDQFHDAVVAQAYRLVVLAVEAGNRDFIRAKTLLERALQIARDPQGRLVLQKEIQSLETILTGWFWMTTAQVQSKPSTQLDRKVVKSGCLLIVGLIFAVAVIGNIIRWWQQTNSASHRENKLTVQHRSKQTISLTPSSPKPSSPTRDQWIKYLGLQQYLKEYKEGRLKHNPMEELLSDLTYEQSHIELDKETYADLDGDGLKEKIVIIRINAGGSGTFVYLLVVKKGKFVAVKSLGDRTVINSLTVKKREIILDMLTHGPNDPMATPTKKVVTRYKLVGKNLMSEKDLRIAQLKRRIKNLELEIERTKSTMLRLTDSVITLRSNIATLQGQITVIEQTHPLGFSTEEELQNYRALVQKHNDLVDKHNALVRKGRSLLQQYNQKIAEYRRLTDEYNNLLFEAE